MDTSNRQDEEKAVTTAVGYVINGNKIQIDDLSLLDFSRIVEALLKELKPIMNHLHGFESLSEFKPKDPQKTSFHHGLKGKTRCLRIIFLQSNEFPITSGSGQLNLSLRQRNEFYLLLDWDGKFVSQTVSTILGEDLILLKSLDPRISNICYQRINDLALIRGKQELSSEQKKGILNRLEAIVSMTLEAIEHRQRNVKFYHQKILRILDRIS